jgi:hypothetical protein
MSHEDPVGVPQSGSIAGLSTPTIPKEKKNGLSVDAVENAIKITKVAKGATETVPLLSPLRATMSSLITLLETIKVNSLE